ELIPPHGSYPLYLLSSRRPPMPTLFPYTTLFRSSVAGKIRMERKSDESALQPVVDRKRKGGGDVRVHGRLVAAVEQVQESARVVGEPAAVGKIADVIDPCPAGRHDVLVGRTQLARIGQPRDILDFDRETTLRDRRRQRSAD